MQLTLLNGYPDNIGRRHAWVGFGSGPESYHRHTRDPVFFPRQTFYIDVIIPALSTSGDYMVYGVAHGVGPRLDWALKWVDAESGEEVSEHEDLSEETVQIGG